MTEDLSSNAKLVGIEIDDALQKLKENGHRAMSWSSLLGLWGTFARRVVSCYDDSIYEYLNDLSVRDNLEFVLNEVSDDTRRQLEEMLLSVDLEFSKATVPLLDPIPGSPNNSAWWWYRLPTVLSPEMESDLNPYGLRKA